MRDQGSAFPIHPDQDNDYLQGMSYRQWLIGTAASGILSDPNVRLNSSRHYQAIADQSINVADAIIAALEKEGK